MSLSDRIERNETRALSVNPSFSHGRLVAVDVLVEIDGNPKMLAVEVYVKLWGDVTNAQGWMVYLLDGKLAMCTVEHRYHPSNQAYQLALDTISEHFGGKREYITDFHDEHYWLDHNGNSAELREDDMESVLFHYTCSEGVRTVVPKGILAEYEIHPDHYDIILEATASGNALSHC